MTRPTKQACAAWPTKGQPPRIGLAVSDDPAG